MTSIRVFPKRDPGSLTGIKAVGVGVSTSVAVLLWGLVSCQGDARSEDRSGEAALKTATIRVISGNGRLAGGEEYEIAEWRTGTQSTGNEKGREHYYADFRGQDGGPTIDLSLKGLSEPGEFACGDATMASLELRVDVNNAYRAVPEAPCRVEVKSVEGGVMVGYYTATLRHTGNPSDEMTVAGEFRATIPDGAEAAVEIKAAKGPKIGLR